MTTRPFMMFMNSSGWIDAPKVWIGSTTTTSGAWSIDYTSAGFDNVPKILPIPELSAANVYDRAFCSLSTAPTSTAAAGYAMRGANLLVLGPTIRTIPDGTTIHIIAIGS